MCLGVYVRASVTMCVSVCDCVALLPAFSTAVGISVDFSGHICTCQYGTCLSLWMLLSQALCRP